MSGESLVLTGHKALAALLRAPSDMRSVAACLFAVGELPDLGLVVAALRYVPRDLLDSVLPDQPRIIERVTLGGRFWGGDVLVHLRPVSNAQAATLESALDQSRSHKLVLDGLRPIAELLTALEKEGFSGAVSFIPGMDTFQARYVRPSQKGRWRQAMVVEVSWGHWLEGD